MKRKRKKTVTVAGLEMEVVSEAEAERAEVLVCSRVADDMLTRQDWPALFDRRRKCLCAWCGEPIWWDPLRSPKQPARVCTVCVIEGHQNGQVAANSRHMVREPDWLRGNVPDNMSMDQLIDEHRRWDGRSG